MRTRNIPKQLRDVTVSIGGAVMTGVLYCSAAIVFTGTIGLTSATHAVLLLVATAIVMVPTVLSIRGERRIDKSIDLEERRA